MKSTTQEELKRLKYVFTEVGIFLAFVLFILGLSSFTVMIIKILNFYCL